MAAFNELPANAKSSASLTLKIKFESDGEGGMDLKPSIESSPPIRPGFGKNHMWIGKQGLLDEHPTQVDMLPKTTPSFTIVNP